MKIIIFLMFLINITSNSIADESSLTHQLNLNVKMEEISDSIAVDVKEDIASIHAKVLNGLIDHSKVKAISYVLATDIGLGRSSFGHSYIRISYEEELSDTDLVIEFVADVKAQDLNYGRALGLGENYGIKLVKTTYEKAREIHVFREDRDLKTYVLSLNKLKIKSIIRKINELLISGVNRKYSFFVTNCADIVTEVLNKGLEQKIKGIHSIIPNQIPKKLYELNLVKDLASDNGKTKKRISVVDESYPSFMSRFNGLEYHNVRANLSSQSLGKRMQAFYRIHLLKERMSLNESLKITAFITPLLKFEGPIVKDKLIELFSTEKVKIQEFAKIRFKLPFLEKAKVLSTKFKVKKSKVYIVVSIRKKQKKYKYEFFLKNMKYENGKVLDETGNIISYMFSPKIIKNKFYHPSTEISSSIIKKSRSQYLVSFLFSEKEKYRLKMDTSFDGENELAYKNDALSINGLGVCNAYVELVKKLGLHGVFLPNEKPVELSQKTKLIKDIFNNKVVIISGYSNTKDFTHSLPMAELSSLLKERQDEKYSMKNRFFDYFSDLTITSKNIDNLIHLIDLGSNPIIGFRTRGNIGHSVLVTKIIDKGEYYELDIIDPNMSYQEKVYKFDKNTSKLQTVFYGDVDIILPKLDLALEIRNTLIMKSQGLKNRMIKSFQKNSVDSFSYNDFF